MSYKKAAETDHCNLNERIALAEAANWLDCDRLAEDDKPKQTKPRPNPAGGRKVGLDRVLQMQMHINVTLKITTHWLFVVNDRIVILRTLNK